MEPNGAPPYDYRAFDYDRPYDPSLYTDPQQQQQQNYYPNYQTQYIADVEPHYVLESPVSGYYNYPSYGQPNYPQYPPPPATAAAYPPPSTRPFPPQRVSEQIEQKPNQLIEPKIETKKQYKCEDCERQLSSARNLSRHRNSCKARRRDEPETSQTAAPPVYPQNTAIVYHLPPPHYPPAYQSNPPHSALPMNQTVFEYPSTGANGMHSAPPTLPPHSFPSVSFEPPRQQFDSSMETLVVEAAVIEETETFIRTEPTPTAAEPKPSSPQKPKKISKKNSQPTPFQCNACLKFMCSQRSLRRHKSTCKLYIDSTPELTKDERQLIAKNEENRCENCGRIFQSVSNLRRHRGSCKQRSEEESHPDNSPSRNPTIVEHLNSNPAAADPSVPIFVKTEPPTDLTVGEHLRHHYNKPQNVKSPKKRKASLQPPSRSPPPLTSEAPATCPPAHTHLSPQPTPDEATRKSEQVADVVNSVVEKIRRQNADGRPQPTSIITTQPLPTNSLQLSKTSELKPKIVPRYLCPECLRFYACRKNAIAHRINEHKLTEADTNARPAKRVKVTPDGVIITPGFEKENALLRERDSELTAAIHLPQVPKSETFVPTTAPSLPLPPPPLYTDTIMADLDAWDQIRARVEDPFNHSNEMDVARIAADLKRSAEESQMAESVVTTSFEHPVELAEADSTCEEM